MTMQLATCFRPLTGPIFLNLREAGMSEEETELLMFPSPGVLPVKRTVK